MKFLNTIILIASFILPYESFADQAGGVSQATANTANFLPYETVPLSASTTSSQVVFYLPQSAINDSVMIANSGTVTAFYVCGYTNSGANTITATVPGTNGTIKSTPILAGEISVFKKNTGANNSDTCAAITSSSTTTLYFTSGQGQ
jgi:hypothetical protein